MKGAYRFPPFLEEDSPNGMHFVWVPDDEQDAVTLVLQLPRGKLHDPVGQEGVSELAIALMQKGTTRHSAEEFSELWESEGASLFADMGEEQTVIGCRFLSRCSGAVVPLFFEMVTSPLMDPRELDRLKKEMLTGLQAEKADPGALSGKHFHAFLYGGDHPVGRSATPQSVKRITTEAVCDACRRIVQPGGAVLAAGGQLDVDGGHNAWKALFAGWNEEGGAAGDAPMQRPSDHTGRRARLVDKRGITQASMVLGHLMPGEDSPHRHETGLANYILGAGNFSSRLMAEVRARMGKTYGISSQLVRFRGFGHLLMGTATMATQVGTMLELVLDVYSEFCSKGVSNEELERAKQYATGSLAFQLEGVGHVVEKLLWLRMLGRDKGYLEGYSEAIMAIDRDGVNQAIRDYFTPEHLSLVVVGNRAEITPQLDGFGLLEHVNHRDPVRQAS